MSTIAPAPNAPDSGLRRLDDLVPAGFSTKAFCGEGVPITILVPGTSLTVRTCQSEYRLTVLEGERREVLVRGGLWFPEATLAHLKGSTAGGSALKSGWIGVGLRMEFSIGPETITTSRVQSISIEQPHGYCGGATA